MIDLSGLSHKFKKPTTQEWVELIEKELKGNTWESLNVRLNDRIEIPAGMLEPDGQPVQLTPHKDTNKWSIAEFFFEEQVSYPTLLSNALSGGLEAPFLLADISRSTLSENVWEGVFTDYVDTFYVQPNIEWFKSYAELLLSRQDNKQQPIRGGFLPIIENEEALKSWINTISSTSSIPKYFKCYHIAPHSTCIYPNIDIQLADIVSRVILLAECGGVEALDKLLVSIPIGDQIIYNVATLRALRVLLHNIWLYYGGKADSEPGFSIHAFNDSCSYEESENTNRIRGSLQGLSMVWGVADYINILPGELQPADENKLFNRRIARNLNHLYRHESYLEEKADPLSGSYVLESLTRQIAEQAWNLSIEALARPEARAGFFPFSFLFSSRQFGNY